MNIKHISIDLIKPYEKNAKKHPKKQVEQVANSIKEFGFNQPIVVDKDNVIIVGHGRYEASKHLKMKEVPVLTVDLSEEQAKAYRLADNKLNESEWDMSLVIDELKDLSEPMIDLTGFDKDLELETSEPRELDDDYKDTRARITITFVDVQDLEDAKVKIEEILKDYNDVIISVGGGEL